MPVRHPASRPPSCPAALVIGLALLALSGCGDGGGEAVDPIPLSAVPHWRILRETGRGEEQGFGLQCGRPWRVRFRVSRRGEPDMEGPWRTLALGQDVRVRFSVGREDTDAFDTDKPSREEAAAGRTEPHAAILRFQFEDRRGALQRFVFWSRPGKGAVQHLAAVLPGTYQPVRPDAVVGPFSLELATIAMTDLVTAKPTLRFGEPLNRLTLSEGRADGDVDRIIRLFIDFDPVR